MIEKKTCPSCGRDNSDYENVCTSDDCPAVQQTTQRRTTMGTEIKTKMKDHLINEFWGGDRRGVCLQITASSPLRVRETPVQQLQEEGFVQLTVEEATTLCNDLEKFIKRRERK